MTTLPDLTAQLEALKAENAALKASSALKMKVSSKGGISLYGLQRFPVTLYKAQWEKVIAAVPELQAFIEANEGDLTVK